MGMRMDRTLTKASEVAWTAGAMVVSLVRDVLAAAPDNNNNERQLQDTDVIGEYNYRTGRLDAGNDPYGWYEED